MKPMCPAGCKRVLPQIVFRNKDNDLLEYYKEEDSWECSIILHGKWVKKSECEQIMYPPADGVDPGAFDFIPDTHNSRVTRKNNSRYHLFPRLLAICRLCGHRIWDESFPVIGKYAENGYGLGGLEKHRNVQARSRLNSLSCFHARCFEVATRGPKRRRKSKIEGLMSQLNIDRSSGDYVMVQMHAQPKIDRRTYYKIDDAEPVKLRL